jgi:hypothetical protein
MAAKNADLGTSSDIHLQLCGARSRVIYKQNQRITVPR